MNSLRVQSDSNEAECWNLSPRIVTPKKLQKDQKLNKTYKGTIQKEQITLELQDDKLEILKDNTIQCINFSDILSVKKARKNSDICIYYLKKSDGYLIFTKLNMKLRSIEDSSELSKSISKKLKKQNRMKNLVVIIDNGDGNNCEALFDTNVKPMLDKIDVKCHLTSLSDWSKSDEILKEVEVTNQTDAIFLFGGDKFINTVLNHLLKRTEQENCTYFRTPFAIIPTGKSNEIFTAFSDETDIEQIVLGYLIGRIIQVDLLSVCVNNQSTYWGFNCQYGLWETVNSSSEDDKPGRRLKKIPKFALEQLISKHKKVEIDPDFLPNGLRCDFRCKTCNIDKAVTTSSPVYNLETKRRSSVAGKFLTQDQEASRLADDPVIGYMITSGITINSIPCRNAAMASLGYTPGCHIANSMFDAIIVRSLSGKDIKKYNKALLNGSHVALPFVSYIRSNQMIICTNNTDQIWSEFDNQQEISENTDPEDNEDIIVIEDSDSLTENENVEEDVEEEINEAKPENLSTIRKHRRSLDLFKNTKLKSLLKRSSSNAEKENPVKSDKQRKKIEKQNAQMPRWTIDHNVINETVNSIHIKLHSGLLSFYVASL